MKELMDLAKRIKNSELREKVIEFLKDPKLSHRDFKKYPQMKIKDARTPFVGGDMGPIERDVLNHTIALTELCESVAGIIESKYKIPLNKDHVIAAAILHDLMKMFEWKETAGGLEPTGILLDHSMLGVAEFYHRGFPEQVIHIIASHFGANGPTPPRSFEALMFHHLDTMLSLMEYNLYASKPQQMPIVLLDDDTIKKLAGDISDQAEEIKDAQGKKSKAD